MPFTPAGAPSISRQHQVDDVVSEVVLAGGDEDFLASDGVGTVGLRDRAGLDEAEIGAAMRLGQAHRACPLAGGHFRQIAGLEIVAAMDRQRRDRAIGQARVHPEGDVGGIGVFAEQDRQKRRQTLAAEGRIARQPDPSAFDQRLVGLLEALRGGHAAVVVAFAAFDVADAVQRLDNLLDELRALAEHRLDNVDRRLREAGSVGIIGVVEHVVQQKNGVAHRRLVCRHRTLRGKSGNPPKRRRRKRRDKVHI